MIMVSLLFCATIGLTAGCAHTRPPVISPMPVASLDSLLNDAPRCDRILALDPLRLSAEDIRTTLHQAPAPRILAFNGSAFNTMDPFSRFLIRMGYPEASVRNPANGAL